MGSLAETCHTYIIDVLDCVPLFQVKLEGMERCRGQFLAPAKSLVLQSRMIFYSSGQNPLDPDIYSIDKRLAGYNDPQVGLLHYIISNISDYHPSPRYTSILPLAVKLVPPCQHQGEILHQLLVVVQVGKLLPNMMRGTL